MNLQNINNKLFNSLDFNIIINYHLILLLLIKISLR